MPYGQFSTPAVFLCLISEVLQQMLGKYVTAHIEDILIYSTNKNTQIHHIKRVLTQLLKHQLLLILSSWRFMVRAILSQWSGENPKLHTVASFSKKLSPTKRNYACETSH